MHKGKDRGEGLAGVQPLYGYKSHILTSQLLSVVNYTVPLIMSAIIPTVEVINYPSPAGQRVS